MICFLNDKGEEEGKFVELIFIEFNYLRFDLLVFLFMFFCLYDYLDLECFY